jgi:3,4-dihydroxyphenylacetate 2,3-dioxygenase|tara:strand:+ start:8252 stop:8761 length:510 start_codon:yes stop_codon:yes gene_type:complete
MGFSHCGNSEFGQSLAKITSDKSTDTLCHCDVPTLPLQYGTLFSLRYIRIGREIKVVSIASWMVDADLDESRIMREAVLEAAKQSDRRFAFLASGSLSHKILPKEVVNDYLSKISDLFKGSVDQMVLGIWQNGQTQKFLDSLPEYARDCNGEGGMHDTVMLFGALGWAD